MKHCVKPIVSMLIESWPVFLWNVLNEGTVELPDLCEILVSTPV